MILEGMHPQYGHSPPTSFRSMPRTSMPASAVLPATSSPPTPRPITIRSCSLVMIAPQAERLARDARRFAYVVLAPSVPPSMAAVRPDPTARRPQGCTNLPSGDRGEQVGADGAEGLLERVDIGTDGDGGVHAAVEDLDRLETVPGDQGHPPLAPAEYPGSGGAGRGRGAMVPPAAVPPNTPAVRASSRIASTTSSSDTASMRPPAPRTAASASTPSAGSPMPSDFTMPLGLTGRTSSRPAANAAAPGGQPRAGAPCPPPRPPATHP